MPYTVDVLKQIAEHMRQIKHWSEAGDHVCECDYVKLLCEDICCVWSEKIIFHLIVIRQLVREQ